MGSSQRTIAAAGVTAALIACAPDPGAVEFKIRWPSGEGAPQQVYLRGEVRVSGGAGTISADPVGPIPFGAQARLDFDRIPNGTGHVAVVEVTETAASDLVLYFGESPPFDLEAGQNQRVEVPIELRRPPDVGTGTLALALLSGADRIRDPRVVLVLRTDTGASVELSNRPSFLRGVRRFDLADVEGASATCPPPSGVSAETCAYQIPWNLDEGLDDSCGVQDSCPRAVFARFFDAAGFRSGTVSTSVTLDTKPPEVFAATIDPPLVSAEAELLVQVNLQEAVLPQDVALVASSTDAEVRLAFPPEDERDAPSANYTFSVRPRGGRWSPALVRAGLGFRLDATDLVGNRTVPPIELAARPSFDVGAPAVTGLSLDPRLLAAGETQAILRFTTDDDVDPAALRIETSPVPITSGGDQGVARVDARTCALTPGAAGTTDYDCVLDLDGFTLSGLNGIDLPVRVEARDPAGNVGGGSTILRIDTVAPAVLDPATVVYLPGPDNPLVSPRAAAADTTVQVRLLFDEAVDTSTAPTMTARLGLETLDFTLVAFTEGSAEFTATIPPGQPSGVYVPEIRLTDGAGNVNEMATFTMPFIVVDTDADVLSVRQDQVSYVRAPLGYAADEPLLDAQGALQYTIPASPVYFALAPPDVLDATDRLAADTFAFVGGGAIEELHAYDSAEATTLLQVIEPERDGTWHRDALRLANTDVPRVYVAGVDNAGNESTPVLIDSAWLIARPGVSAVTGARPHVVRASGFAAPPLAMGAVSTSTGPEARDGRPLSVRAAARWARRDAAGTLPPLGFIPTTNIAYDHARGRLVALEQSQGRTFELEGKGWVEVVTPAAPPNRRSAPMFDDPVRGGVIVFSGMSTNNTPRGDMWTFDGQTWTDITPTGAGPGARNPPPAMAYDSKRERFVAFGGSVSPGPNLPVVDQNDMFVIEDGRWREITPTAGPYPPAARYIMAYDEGRDRMVLIVLGDVVRETPDEVWEFDGRRWHDVTPAAPIRSAANQMYYDRRRGEVVVFSLGTTLIASEDTQYRAWSWNGQRWQALYAHPPPFDPFVTSVRVNGAAYDPAADEVVTLMGLGRQIFVPPFQEFSYRLERVSVGQRRALTTDAPPAASSASLVYDSARDRAVLFGGSVSQVGAVGQTWVYDGLNWTQLPGAGPSARSNHAMAYDAGRDQIVLFGGLSSTGDLLGDTWLFDGGAWQRATPTVQPPVRRAHTMTYDPIRQEVLLYGGAALTTTPRTWAWNGQDWRAVTSSTALPARRNEAGAIWDSVNQRVLVHGGNAPPASIPAQYPELWAWDGQAWSDVTVPDTPDISTHALVYDPRRARAVAFNGSSTDQGLISWFDDTLVLDAQGWRDLAPLTPAPTEASNNPAVYFEAQDEVLLFVGTRATVTLNAGETWALEAADRPAVQVELQLPNDIPRTALTGARIRAFCSGRARIDGADTPGADLFAWRGAALVPLASTTATTTRGGAMQGALTWPAMGTATASAARALVGPGERMFLQCRSAGEGEATVDLDYVEARIRYRP